VENSKRVLGRRTPNGSNADLKALRKDQSANIAKVLDGLRHLLPTLREILDKIWLQHPSQQQISLRTLGLALPFCDGIGVPKTKLTATERQVRELF